jgi:hypothetical protein
MVSVVLALALVSVVQCKHCTPSDLKLSEFHKAQWLLELDGTFALSFPHCTLRHFSAHAAKECLGGKHLVFMGDSLTRYFYLSLAHLLATDHWSPKLAHVTNSKYPPSIMWEKDWDTWAAYYQQSNAALNRHTKGARSYELCDCFRDDTVPWSAEPDCGANAAFCSQEESMIENRNLRVYTGASAPGAGGATAAGGAGGAAAGAAGTVAGLADMAPLLRLTYMQFFGLMPMRGRSVLAAQLPRSEQRYVAYLDQLGSAVCPAATAGAAKGSRHGLVPITGKCGLRLRDLRDDPAYKHDFPQFYDDLAGRLEKEVLGPIGATHLLVNIGWHAPLRGESNETETDAWIEARLRGAQKHFDASYDRERPLFLPQVTWRGTTAFGPFGEGNDQTVERFRHKHPRPAGGELGYNDLWGLTERLWEIHKWIAKTNGSVGLHDLVGDLDGASAQHTRLDDGWRDLQLLDIRLSARFKAKVSSLFKHHHTSSLVLPPIFLDHAHPQPWVYNELNNALLNAICPV